MTDTSKTQQPEDYLQHNDNQLNTKPEHDNNYHEKSYKANKASSVQESSQPSTIDEANNDLPLPLSPTQDSIRAVKTSISTTENENSCNDNTTESVFHVQDSPDTTAEIVSKSIEKNDPSTSTLETQLVLAPADSELSSLKQDDSSLLTTNDCADVNNEIPISIYQGGTLRLPNARQNQPYHVVLNDKAICCNLKALRLIDDCATTLTLDGYVLRGIPAVSGECSLRLHGTREDGNSVTLTLALLINPDPKTLWHNIEPQSSLFRKPHQDWQHAADKRVSITAARVRGRSHAHKGSFCEDDIAILVDATGVGYFGMVADGAGSSRFSRLASQLLCNNLPRHLSEEIKNLQNSGEFIKLYELLDGNDNQREQALNHIGDILANAVKRALHDLLEHTLLAVSEIRNHSPQPITIKDLYSTCLAFWVLPLADNCWALASYWVGDGGLAVKHNNRFTLLGIPDGGEFSGQTRFLAAEETTNEALSKRLQTKIYHDLQSVWAMTDGITDAKFTSEQQLENSEQWQKLTDEIIPALSSADSIYDWLGFWSQGNHDDRSLCVLRVLPCGEHKEGSEDE